MSVAAYPLHMLIGVCKLREDAAASAMRTAEANLREEEEREVRLRRELEEYKVWRVGEEDRRYAELIGSETDGPEMERFRAGLASLKDREIEYEGAIMASKKRQVELDAIFRDKRRLYNLAVQETQKIGAHREGWMEEWNREQARLEDIEMEDFTKAPRRDEHEESADGEDDGESDYE